jgi:hypothetical protein
MHIHTWFLTLAEDAEDAKSTVSGWIDEHFEREFYDYGGLEEGERVSLVSEVIKELNESREYTENEILPEVKRDIEKYNKDGNRSMEGYCYVRYGNILQESFCPDMPYFNIAEWDWSIPTEVPDSAKDCQWFAVRVDLHF